MSAASPRTQARPQRTESRLARDVEPDQVRKQQDRDHDGGEPRLDGAQRRAPALGRPQERPSAGEQDQARIGGEQQQAEIEARARTSSGAGPRRWRARNAAAVSADSAMPRIGGPKSGDGTVITVMPSISSTAIAACCGADDRAAEREHRPIGDDHAGLRQQVDADDAERSCRTISASQKASGGPRSVPSWNSCPTASTSGSSPGGAA